MPYLGQRPSKGDENNFKILDDISSYTLTFDGSDSSVVSAANDTITSLTHRFVQGQRVTYTTTGEATSILGLSDDTVYFIIKEDHNTIKLATSASNAANGIAVNIINVGSGSSHTLNVAFDGVNTKFKATHTNGQKARITRSAQLVISMNGVIQQPHDSATPSTGFGFDLDGTIVFSQAPVSSDVFWAHVLTNNNVTFDISNNDIDNFTGDGNTREFNLSKSPPDNRNVLVTIDGVIQYPNDPDGTIRSYSVVENVLTFVTAPASGVEIQVRHIGFAGSTSGSGGVTSFYGRTGAVVLKDTDNISVNDAAVTGDLTVTGDMTVNGTTTTLDTNLIDVDKIEVLTAGANVAVAITQSGTGDILKLYDSSTPVFVVKDGGRVGIGTDNPNAELDIEGEYARIHLHDRDGNQAQILQSGNALYLNVDAEGNDNGSFRIRVGGNTGASEKLRIDSDGRLMVGNTAASSFNASTNQLVVGNGVGNQGMVIYTGASHSGNIIFNDVADGTYQGGISYKHGSGASDNCLKFYVNADERLRITSDGKTIISSPNAVGQTPVAILDVFNQGTSTQALRVYRNDLNDNTLAAFESYHNALGIVPKMVITSRGRVGINTNNPQRELHVKPWDNNPATAAPGYVRIEGQGANQQGVLELYHTRANGSDKWPVSVSTDDAAITFNVASAANGTPSEKVRITSTGQLTSTASNNGQIIHYFKNTDTTASSSAMTVEQHFNFNRTGGGIDVSAARIVAGKEREWVGAASNQDGYFAIHTTQNETSTEKLRIQSDGKVGIGITNPAEKFEVKSGSIGLIGGGSYKIDTHPLVSYASFTDISGGSYAARLGSTGTSTIRSTQIYGGGGHIATFDGVNKRLGINITAPEAALHIAFPANNTLRFTNTDTTVTSNDTIGKIEWETKDSNAAGVHAYLKVLGSNTGYSSMHFGTGNATTLTDRLVITQSGNICVNVTNPDAKLDVTSGSDSEMGLRVSGGASGGTNIAQFRTNNGTSRFTINNDVTVQTGNLVIDGGKLLVGTTSGTSHHISSGASTLNTVFQANLGGAGATCAIRVKMNTSANDGLQIQQNGSGTSVSGGAHCTSIFNREDGPMRFGTDNTERLLIRNNGSMIAQTGSLGTTPLMELYNTDGDASTGTILKLRTGRGQSTKDMPIFHITDGSDNSVFEVENSGRVGIFNAAPAHLIDILNNTSDEGIRLRSTGNTYHSFYFDANRGAGNNHIGRFIARWNGTNTSMIAMNTGSDVTNKDNGFIAFAAAEADGTLTTRFLCNGSAAGLVMQNDCYISIPHDERCIVFDEGQKMITSNDGQGNFNIIAGKNHDAQHVNSSSGNSGIAQIEINSDGANGNIHFAVGPQRSAGSSAVFTNGFRIKYQSSGANGLVYCTGSSTSPSGLTSEAVVLNSSNAASGTWNTNAGAIFRCLGDGGSVALTTNDGGGNANVTFNHANQEADTAGSSWRIRTDIDNTNSHFYIQNATSVTNGQTNISMSNRLEIAENGTFYGSASNNISDQRLKKNIATITDATTKIKGLIGRTFEWKEEAQLETGTQYGFIAQEMETVISDLVSDSTKAGLRSFDKDGNLLSDNYSEKDKIAEYSKGVNVNGVVPILVEALKEAIAEIETLKTRVSTLEGS